MFLTLDETSEIEQLNFAARFLKARANAMIAIAYSGGQYDYERQDTLIRAADCLTAADKLQGRANMLDIFGRDYEPADFLVLRIVEDVK